MKADARTEAEVKAVMDKFSESYARRDEAALLASTAPDADVILYGTGADEKRVGREEILDQARRDWSQSDSIAIDYGEVSVSAAGPVAWAAADGAFKVEAGGQAFSIPARVTMVLERRGDDWLLVHGHFSAPMSGQEEGESFPD